MVTVEHSAGRGGTPLCTAATSPWFLVSDLVWQPLYCITELHVLVAVYAAHPAVDAVHSSSIQVACGLTLLHVGKVVGVPVATHRIASEISRQH